MRDISAALKERFAREDLSICRCVILRLKGGAVYYLTDLNRPIKVNGLTFKPEPHIDVSAIRTAKDTASQNAEIMLSYEETGLSERPIRFGLINDALCEIYWVDYRMPQLGGALMLAGKVAAVEQPRKSYCILRIGATSTTGNNLLVAEVFSKRCRNNFGDKRCKVNVDALSVPFTVVQTFPDAAQFAINGYAEFIPPEGEIDLPPRENGKYVKPDDGETYFKVPDAQIMRVRIKSSGGGGGEGGRFKQITNGNLTYQSGVLGDRGFDTYFDKTDTINPGAVILKRFMRVGAGIQGNPFFGYNQKYSKPLELYEKMPQTVGAFIREPIYEGPGVTITAKDLSGGAKGGKGGVGGGGATTSDGGMIGLEAQGQDGGNGALVEFLFNLEDPACPLHKGDFIHISVGSPGATSGVFFRGEEGSVEITWQSNIGEPIIEKTFDLGTVLWTKGNNTSQVNQIAANTTGLITLTSNPRLPIEVGDEGMFRPGCSNFADMCETRWNNLINMQAEPVTPQGVTTAPSPIADTSKDLTKPAPVGQLTDYGFSGPIRGGG